MIKKSLAILLVLLISLSMCACSVTKNDERFLKNLQRGLEARWTLTEKEPSTPESNSDNKDSLKKFVNAELTAIGDISEYIFEDSNLKAYAQSYVNALISQSDGISYYGTDEAKYEELFVTNGLVQRATHDDVVRVLDDYMDYYNNDRYQWELAKLSPREYYAYVTTDVYPLKIPTTKQSGACPRTPGVYRFGFPK